VRHEISDKVWTWEPAATLQCGCAQTGCSVAHQPMKIMFGDRHEEMTSWTPQALFLSIPFLESGWPTLTLAYPGSS